MYLITVEGGDGSGKGEAVRILTELLAQYPFNEVHKTHEPRRHSDLGKLALEAVKEGNKTPLQEAGLFAADRLDHSHTWIKPRLERGEVVVSDRNIHSSIIYQGVVGELGIDTVCHVNSASMIPDLVVWIDCDPDRAIDRIKHATLRMSSDKQEYFETPEIQKTIRQGFHDLFTGELKVAPPFDKCCIVGPILNEGGLDELRQKLRTELRSFFNRRPLPLNVDVDKVDRYLLKKLAHDVQQQTRLPERLWNVHLCILDGSAVALQHSGCKVQKTNGIQVRQENPMFQTILWHDRVGRFLAPYPSWQDHVKFHDCTNRWGRIGWLRNVILRGLSSGLKRQIGFIVNKTMFHLQKDKSSSYETHGLDLLASHLPCGRFE